MYDEDGTIGLDRRAMTSSTNYDPVADRYDATRAWPADVTAAFVAGLAYVLPPDAPILEVGAGTGRIARPLRAQNIPVIGIDLSARMLAQFAAQSGTFSTGLVQGDITALPFARATFGGVYAVHVFHLVGKWQDAIHEIQRILRPGGLFLNCSGDEVANDITNHMSVGWSTIVRRNGLTPAGRSGVRSQTIFNEELRKRGATCETIPICRWREAYSPRRQLAWMAARLSPSTWHIPDPLFAKCLTDYERWLKAQYSELDKPLELIREVTLDVWHWTA
ncbi:MAG: class I SAM-dependent methyltransferase [Anaerolineae bacterium]|nr:class I SAM-dependent methyltransferase [Anaerolineae bacterium]